MPINKTHADVKYSDIQQVLTSTLEHREFLQESFLINDTIAENLLSVKLIF